MNHTGKGKYGKYSGLIVYIPSMKVKKRVVQIIVTAIISYGIHKI